MLVQHMILEYMRNPTSNKMVKNQLEILMPLGGAGFVGHELNKE